MVIVKQLTFCKSYLVSVYNLFGYYNECTVRHLMSILNQDLNCSFSPHSLFQKLSVPGGDVPVPLMVCGSCNDIVVEPDALQGRQPWLKEGNRLWMCPEGRHFFTSSTLSWWETQSSISGNFYTCRSSFIAV